MAKSCYRDFIAYNVRRADGRLIAGTAKGVSVMLAVSDIDSCKTQHDFEQLLCDELSDKLGYKAASFGSYEMAACC